MITRLYESLSESLVTSKGVREQTFVEWFGLMDADEYNLLDSEDNVLMVKG